MKPRVLVIVASVTVGLACTVAVASAIAAPQDAPVGSVVVTETTSAPPGAERTPSPGSLERVREFEKAIEQPAQDADGRTIPPDEVALPQGR